MGDLLILDTPVDFLPVHLDVLRRAYADADLIAHDAKHGDSDVIANVQCFANATGEYQHGDSFQVSGLKAEPDPVFPFQAAREPGTNALDSNMAADSWNTLVRQAGSAADIEVG